jgi:hypothetical protein
LADHETDAQTDTTALLAEVVGLIEADPHAAVSLTLYALVSTLEYEQAGCLFKLTKLRDLTPEARRIAYRLMERLAEGPVAGPEWAQAKARMDGLVRRG